MKKHCYISILLLAILGFQAQGQLSLNQQLLILKTYLSQGKIQEAQQFIDKNIKQWTPELLMEQGNAYYLASNFKEALNQYLQANQQNNNMGVYQIAACYAQINKPEQACGYLKQHLQSKNRGMQFQIKSDEAFRTIGNSSAWKELWKTDWYSKYELMFEDAWYEYLNKKYAESLEILNQLTGIRKSMTEAFYLKALVYEVLGENENALICIDNVLNKKTVQAKDYLVKSRLELKTQNPRKAFKAIEAALESDSTQMDLYLERAKINLAMEKEEAAVQDIAFLLEYAPSTQVYLLASDIYAQAKEYNLAIKSLNQCILTDTYQPELYIRRGDLYAQTLLFEFAIKDFTMALDFQPADGELYYKRGKARLGMGNRTDACSDFQKAYSLKFTEADAMIRQHCQQHLK